MHCTGVLAADAFEAFGVPRDALLNPLSTVRFFAPSGETVTYETPSVEAVVIDRLLFDRSLDAAARRSGARIVVGARVTNVQVEGGAASLFFASGPPARARAVILACGANYVLQRRLGLGVPGVFLQSAQMELPATAVKDVEVHFGRSTAPGGFAWTVPVVRRHGHFARVGLMSEAHAARHFRAFLERVAPRWGIPLSGRAPQPRLKMLPLAPIARTHTNRVLAVGDAAGIVKATTGGGIYYSLLSARLASEVLTSALERDRLNAADLAAYPRLWKRELGAELRAQLSLREVAGRLSDAQIDELFDLARTDGIMPIVRRTARFNEHRQLIVSLLHHPPARRVLFRRLTNWRGAAAL